MNTEKLKLHHINICNLKTEIALLGERIKELQKEQSVNEERLKAFETSMIEEMQPHTNCVVGNVYYCVRTGTFSTEKPWLQASPINVVRI